jgi:hypothetical protein
MQQSTESQRIRDQIKAAFIFARANFVNGQKLSNKCRKIATQTKTLLRTKLPSRQPNSVQRETYIRANNNKKKIKEADFPAKAPESNSYKHKAGNAQHSLHDLTYE